MISFFDGLALWINDIYAYLLFHFASKSLFQWLLFFFPFYVFGEFPRYVLPALILSGLRFLGLPRKNVAAEQRFLATEPSVSVLLVGRNEEDMIRHAIETLIEMDYPNKEIIFVDDNSDDATYAVAKPYADKGLIKLYRNAAASGRLGRPSGSNMAYSLASGDFIISVDADTTFDRDMIRHMIAPFHDPTVGAVAGNVKVRNVDESIWTRVQAIEYLQSITLWKTWLNILGWNMQASGALGAFRREALDTCGGWDSETAEDADLSLKIKKQGWRLVFAPGAVALTNVPETLKRLVNQRNLWDRGFFRTYFRKHVGLMRFWRFPSSNAAEMSMEFFFQILLTLIYFGWFAAMLIFYPYILIGVMAITYVFYCFSMLFTFLVALSFSERKHDEWMLVFTIPYLPLYKGIFRWVRLYALVLEFFRINQEHPYLPVSAWRNSPRW